MKEQKCRKINSNYLWIDINTELTLISKSEVFSSKKDVLYLLIQVRKYLEAECILEKYNYIKFYSDWVAHPRKDFVPDFMKNDLLKIQQDKYPVLRALFRFENLKVELSNFFLKCFNQQDPFSNDNLWKSFHLKLIEILDECPLIMSDVYNIEISFSKESGFINLKTDIPNIIGTSFKTYL